VREQAHVRDRERNRRWGEQEERQARKEKKKREEGRGTERVRASEWAIETARERARESE